MKRSIPLLSLSGLALSLSACSSLGPAAGVATTSGPELATLVGPGQLAHSSLPPSLQAIDPRVASRQQVPLPIPTSQPYLQQTAYYMPASSGQFSVDDGACPPTGSGFAPACQLPVEPRVCLPVVQGVEQPATSSELYPDEYICDGGDEGLPTSVAKDGSVVLKFEETVGTFLDDNADRHVEPSTKVCVYAPSFGAVRSISQPILDHKYDRIAGMKEKVMASGYEAPVAISLGRQIDAGMQTRVRSRASEVDVDNGDALLANVTTAENHFKLINVFQGYGFMEDRTLEGNTIVIIKEGIAAAVSWQQGDAPSIFARDEKLNELSSQVVAQEYFDYEDRRADGDLRLIKTANVSAAKAGEEVEFAIRYDNAGGCPVFDVTIVDHLSPRLELIRESVKVDREGEVIVEDDYEGSVYLKVRLKEPLAEKTGGTLTFKCRVRP